MEITVRFPGNRKVDADFNGFVVHTDQPKAAGGDATAPTPFQLFLASLATCGGIYALEYCQHRGIPMDKVRFIQKATTDPATGMVTDVAVTIELPPDFPDKQRDGLVRSVDLCKVKKHIMNPPRFTIELVKGG